MNADTPIPPPAKPVGETLPPAYRSEDLFRGGRVVLIVHEGREYWLRITGTNKLILTA